MGPAPAASPPPVAEPDRTGAPESPPPTEEAAKGEEKQWTPEQIVALLQIVGLGVRYLGDLWWKDRQEASRTEGLRRQHGFRTILVLMGFLGGIVLLMAYMTARGYVSGDALLFLVGAVASWILFAVQRHLFEASQDRDRPLL